MYCCIINDVQIVMLRRDCSLLPNCHAQEGLLIAAEYMILEKTNLG